MSLLEGDKYYQYSESDKDSNNSSCNAPRRIDYLCLGVQ